MTWLTEYSNVFPLIAVPHDKEFKLSLGKEKKFFSVQWPAPDKDGCFAILCLFQSYQDNDRKILKGSVQLNPIYS